MVQKNISQNMFFFFSFFFQMDIGIEKKKREKWQN